MKEIIPWFEKNKREFPWRSQRTPYRVWIAEIMLQQTRASVVIPYFLRWMQQFPDVKALYTAPLPMVIKAWEGLGYYSRARNIHAAAKRIVEDFGGEIPACRKDLLSLPGFGSYTAGAVLSFGFQMRSPAVDGNVLRVLSRYFLIEESVSKMSVRKKIEALAESVLDPDAPWIFSEGLIELGATVCLPRPHCEVCPIRKGCRALESDKAHLLPIKKLEDPIKVLHRSVLVIEHDGYVLLKRGEKGKIMADLYEFPYRESTEKPLLERAVRIVDGSPFKNAARRESSRGSTGSAASPSSRAKSSLSEEEKILQSGTVYKLAEVTHTFTRFKAILYPIWIGIKDRTDAERLVPHEEPLQWHEIETLDQIPFSAGHKKIKEQILLMKGLNRQVETSERFFKERLTEFYRSEADSNGALHLESKESLSLKKEFFN